MGCKYWGGTNRAAGDKKRKATEKEKMEAEQQPKKMKKTKKLKVADPEGGDSGRQ